MGTSEGSTTVDGGFVVVGVVVFAVFAVFAGGLLGPRTVTVLGMLRKLLALPAMAWARLLFISWL